MRDIKYSASRRFMHFSAKLMEAASSLNYVARQVSNSRFKCHGEHLRRRRLPGFKPWSLSHQAVYNVLEIYNQQLVLEYPYTMFNQASLTENEAPFYSFFCSDISRRLLTMLAVQ